MLCSKNRPVLTQNSLVWLEESFRTPGTNLAPLTPRIFYENATLPDEFHGDSADRIIVVTARVFGATLIRVDQKTHSDAEAEHVKIYQFQ